MSQWHRWAFLFSWRICTTTSKVALLTRLIPLYVLSRWKKEKWDTYFESAAYYHYLIPFTNNAIEDVEYPDYMEYACLQYINGLHEYLNDWCFDSNWSRSSQWNVNFTHSLINYNYLQTILFLTCNIILVMCN